MIEVGKKAPEFCLADYSGKEHCLSDWHGSWVIVYFYPKDNTKGCTQEAIDFTDALSEINELEAHVVGISPDSEKSHAKFIEKHDLKILLLSDPEKQALDKWGAWQLKKMYGREYMGVVRSTVIVDPEGIVRYHFPKVRVKGHVEKVIEKLRELKKEG
jgi:peroxiredoxin Q/BCP